MSYNRTLARRSFFVALALDLVLVHWMVWLSTVGDKSEGLWFKFSSIWAIIMIIVTVALGLMWVDKS